MARFFIDRPVLAWVISLVIILLGGIAGALLPIAQYPEITPPTVRVTTNYPGANAKIVADTVAAPIEQQIVGVDNMLYMTSQSNNDGSYTLDVVFALGTDVNMAQVQVQNRVAIAQPAAPRCHQSRRSDGQETVARHSPDSEPLFRKRSRNGQAPLRSALSEQLRYDQPPGCPGPCRRRGRCLLLWRTGLQHAYLAEPR